MLKILGLILGFIIMVLSVIGLLTVDESVLEVPDGGPVEVFDLDSEDLGSVLPELIAGIGSGVSAGDGPDVLYESLPEVVPGAGSLIPAAEDQDLSVLSAGVGAFVDSYDDGMASITFGDGYTMQIPKGLILSDEGTVNDYEITGRSEGEGPAFSIRCVIPESALTMEDLEDICQDLYGEANYVTREDLTYLTAYDADADTQMCIFPSSYSNQVYLIGMTGLSDEMPAQQYFATLTSSPLSF